MIVEISKKENIKLLYILTHSTKNIDKKEVIDRINVGIKNLFQNNEKKVGDYFATILKLKANEENCIFVNFYPEENEPIYGIDEIFKKLSILVKQLKSKSQSNIYEFFTGGYILIEIMNHIC